MSVRTHTTALAGQFPRLSDRFLVRDMTLTVSVPNPRKHFGKKTRPVEMHICDLSIAGALLTGPFSDELRFGTRIDFTYDGEPGSAQIRHLRPAPATSGITDPTNYGVVFAEVPPKLKGIIFEHMASERGKRVEELDHAWDQAQ